MSHEHNTSDINFHLKVQCARLALASCSAPFSPFDLVRNVNSHNYGFSNGRGPGLSDFNGYLLSGLGKPEQPTSFVRLHLRDRLSFNRDHLVT